MNIPALKEMIEERKVKAIENLSTSFAKNRLPLEEYERLVGYISKIESERELIVVEKMVAEYDVKNAEPVDTYEDEDEPNQQHLSRNNLTLLSSRTFAGPLKTGTQFISVLGDASIKIRKKHLKNRRTVLNVVSILSDYVIMVESGIRVINNVVPLLGDTKTNDKVDKEAQDEGPELIISGAALLGDISVKLLKE
ncbi:MAG: hypothetical protein FWB99_08880 [Treponema sp.]|nr:hypothetical protein [Treponema sp.]